MSRTFLLLLFFTCTGNLTAQDRAKSKIIELNKQMENAFNNNDMLKVSAFYLDSSVISGGRMNVTGRSGIDNYWLSLKDKSAKWRLEIDSVEDYGEIVIQKGKSFLSSTNMQSNVRFVLIWKKVNDNYRILYDLFFSM